MFQSWQMRRPTLLKVLKSLSWLCHGSKRWKVFWYLSKRRWKVSFLCMVFPDNPLEPERVACSEASSRAGRGIWCSSVGWAFAQAGLRCRCRNVMILRLCQAAAPWRQTRASSRLYPPVLRLLSWVFIAPVSSEVLLILVWVSWGARVQMTGTGTDLTWDRCHDGRAASLGKRAGWPVLDMVWLAQAMFWNSWQVVISSWS